MKTIKLSMAAAAALILGLSSCKKDEVTPTTPVKKTTTTSTTTSGYGAISIKLAHKFGMMNEQTFALGKQVIHPMKQDTMIFSKFKYFISNIRFKRTDGTYYVENESYRLIDLATPSSLTLALNKIPAGKYTQMEYTMGVDAARNMDGAQTGALAITNDMFWSWNSGYIMLKAEGKYIDNKTQKTFVFHLGGFKGENNIVTKRTMKFDGTNALTIVKDKTKSVAVEVNPGLLWHSAPSVKEVNTIHMPGAGAKLMALGQQGMGFFANPMYSFKLISVK